MNPSFENKLPNPWDRKPTLPTKLNNSRKVSQETQDAVQSILPSYSNSDEDSLLNEVMKELSSIPSPIKPINDLPKIMNNLPKIMKKTPKVLFKRHSKPCGYVIKRGTKKGTTCTTRTKGRYCSKHNKAFLISSEVQKPIFKSFEFISSSDDEDMEITSETLVKSDEIHKIMEVTIKVPDENMEITSETPVKADEIRKENEKELTIEVPDINVDKTPTQVKVPVKKLKLKNYLPTTKNTVASINSMASTTQDEQGTVNKPFKMRRSRMDPSQKYKLLKYQGDKHVIVSWQYNRCFKVFMDDNLERKPLDEGWYLKVQSKGGPAMWKRD